MAGIFVEEKFMKRLVLYTIQGCPYCANARNLLNSNKIDYEEIDITPDAFNMRDKLAKMSVGERSVPQVYINGKYMGQDDELLELIESKKIFELIG
jgi:glutaredoxin